MTIPSSISGRGSSARSPSANNARPRQATAAGRTLQPPQEVRIGGGLWKRTPLPVGDAPGLRPTPARVRETLFNWLGQDLTGWRCIDAFAGTGALGLEAASRGAREVLLVEHNAALVASLRQTVQRLKATQVRLERGDALGILRSLAGQGWDVVFLDPPFLQGDNETLFGHALRAASAVVSSKGFIYLESPRVWTDDELAAEGLSALRRGRAGAVHHSLLSKLDTSAATAGQDPLQVPADPLEADNADNPPHA